MTVGVHLHRGAMPAVAINIEANCIAHRLNQLDSDSWRSKWVLPNRIGVIRVLWTHER